MLGDIDSAFAISLLDSPLDICRSTSSCLSVNVMSVSSTSLSRLLGVSLSSLNTSSGGKYLPPASTKSIAFFITSVVEDFGIKPAAPKRIPRLTLAGFSILDTMMVGMLG